LLWVFDINETLLDMSPVGAISSGTPAGKGCGRGGSTC
jgi:hypothetical protein